MKNSFRTGLQNTPLGMTENGSPTYNSTLNKVLDLFAMGAAMRSRTDEDIIDLFRTAYNEDKLNALRCLFYIGDIRGGQGERRFFRTCYKWLIENDMEVAKKNLMHIPFYKRWDDLIYVCVDTPLQKDMARMIGEQLVIDMTSKTCSLLGKWMPSENTSSKETKRVAHILMKELEYTPKHYRKVLTELRKKINVLEVLMSTNKWEAIEFDKIPSKAGLKYKNAFARHDLIREKYEKFMKDEKTTVNAKDLYPYEIVAKALDGCSCWGMDRNTLSETDRNVIDKYWKNLPDFLNGDASNTICVIDTSGSMSGSSASAPINVAVSLGIYFGERNRGPFKDSYISFASRPQYIEFDKNLDFVDNVRKIYKTHLVDNTNIEAVFDLLLNTAQKPGTKKEDIPENILIISDMEFDQAREDYSPFETIIEKCTRKWTNAGFKLPHLIFWNVDARQNNIPIINKNQPISFVSGMSPSIFTSIITGKKGEDLMMEVLNKYEQITI